MPCCLKTTDYFVCQAGVLGCHSQHVGIDVLVEDTGVLAYHVTSVVLKSIVELGKVGKWTLSFCEPMKRSQVSWHLLRESRKNSSGDMLESRLSEKTTG